MNNTAKQQWSWSTLNILTTIPTWKHNISWIRNHELGFMIYDMEGCNCWFYCSGLFRKSRDWKAALTTSWFKTAFFLFGLLFHPPSCLLLFLILSGFLSISGWFYFCLVVILIPPALAVLSYWIDWLFDFFGWGISWNLLSFIFHATLWPGSSFQLWILCV